MTDTTDDIIDDDLLDEEEQARIEQLEWDGEVVDASTAAKQRAAVYQRQVNYNRQIPDVRDGLLPVQRRIVYVMKENGLRESGRPVKCSKIIGDALGKYHPHGDGAVYGALVRLAVPFKMNVPPVHGQGNFGSPGPDSVGKKPVSDPPAAMRYCVVGDARVRLDDGSTPRIADLVPDAASDSETDVDLGVLDQRAEPVHASKFFACGEHPTLRVSTREGFELTGTHNHPVLCLRDTDTGPALEWVLLEDVQPGDVAAIARLPYAHARDTDEREQVVCLLAGAMVSEGWYNDGRAGFSNCDREYFDAVVSAYDRCVGGARYVNERDTRAGSRIFELDVHDTSSLRGSALGELAGRVSATQRIPETVWAAGPVGKRRFLQALFEGDGSVRLADRSSITVSYSTRSRHLALDVQRLLLEFGVVARRYEAGARGEHRLLIANRRDARLFATRVGFWGTKHTRLLEALGRVPRASRSLSADHVPFVARHVRDQARHGNWSSREWLDKYNFDCVERWERDRDAITSRIEDPDVLTAVTEIVDSGYFFATVTAVDDAGEQPVFSLKIDTDEHSFLTDGFVSHNTEAKLSKAGTDWIADLHPEVVEFVPNYDTSTTEPTVLPVTFPNLLVNGSHGTGWSIANTVPMHNLAETIDAAVLLVDKPDATLKQVMRKLPGPDYPGGGVVVNPERLVDAYATGRGSFKLQGRFHVENLPKGGVGVVITELPFNVSAEQIIEQARIAANTPRSKKDKTPKLTELTKLGRNEGDKNGDRIVFELKRGGNPQILIGQLLAHTSLQDNVTVNITVLDDGHPRELGLVDVLLRFLDFRRHVVTGRYELERRLKLAEHRRKTVMRAAQDVIKKIVAIIEASEDDADTKTKLMALVKVVPYGARKAQPIDEEEATFIMDMQLRRLNKLNRFKLDEEISQLETRLRWLDDVLAHPEKIDEIVKDELRDVKKRYGRPRRTALSGATATAPASDDAGSGKPVVMADVESQPVGVFVSRDGQAICRPAQAKLRDVPLALAAGDQVRAIVDCDTDAALHVFTERGMIYRVRVAELGIDSRKGKGKPVCQLAKGDRVVAVLRADTDGHLALVSRAGQGKRLPQEQLSKTTSLGETVFGGLADTDRLAFVLAGAEDDLDLLVAAAKGKLLRTSLAKLPVKKTPSAGGVALMSFKDPADHVAGVALAVGDRVLTVHETGMSKTVSLADYPAKGRGGAGTGSVKTDVPKGSPAGDVAFVAACPDGPVRVVTASGQIVVVPADALAPLTVATASRPAGWLQAEDGTVDLPVLVVTAP